jgi:hypothetical protein
MAGASTRLHGQAEVLDDHAIDLHLRTDLFTTVPVTVNEQGADEPT